MVSAGVNSDSLLTASLVIGLPGAPGAPGALVALVALGVLVGLDIVTFVWDKVEYVMELVDAECKQSERSWSNEEDHGGCVVEQSV